MVLMRLILASNHMTGARKSPSRMSAVNITAPSHSERKVEGSVERPRFDAFAVIQVVRHKAPVYLRAIVIEPTTGVRLSPWPWFVFVLRKNPYGEIRQSKRSMIR